jgi:hypothetical protein
MRVSCEFPGPMRHWTPNSNGCGAYTSVISMESFSTAVRQAVSRLRKKKIRVGTHSTPLQSCQWLIAALPPQLALDATCVA